MCNFSDYIFEKGILNADDMTIGADSTSLGAMLGGMSIDDIKIKVRGLLGNTDVLKKILKLGADIAAVTAVTAAMPKEYNLKWVCKWVEKYNGCFKR